MDKAKKLFSGLNKQQSIFSHSTEVSDMADKASYLISTKIAVASKPFSDGEFIESCLMKAIEIVSRTCQSFAKIYLTRDTISDRISHLAVGIDD